MLLRKNVTLDPRQKDRLQETGHVFVITSPSTPAIFFILQVKRDGRESPSHPVIEKAIFLKDLKKNNTTHPPPPPPFQKKKIHKHCPQFLLG